jgi:hypothetical protein
MIYNNYINSIFDNCVENNLKFKDQIKIKVRLVN